MIPRLPFVDALTLADQLHLQKPGAIPYLLLDTEAETFATIDATNMSDISSLACEYTLCPIGPLTQTSLRHLLHYNGDRDLPDALRSEITNRSDHSIPLDLGDWVQNLQPPPPAEDTSDVVPRQSP